MPDNRSLIDELKEKVAGFSRGPGVYLMKDSAGKVIYVGKARALRDRVRSYFGQGDTRLQVEYLMRKVQSIDTISTPDEEQALILENELIKRYKPRYNIRLKDDKAYFSVRINEQDEWPRLELVRRVQDDAATYYGPFTSSNEIRNVLELIKQVVPLRSCSDTVLHNRQRPCLEYEIKRCAGPCCLPVDGDDYREWVRQAKSLLEGKTQVVIKDLNRRMDSASQELRFEEAAIVRDRIDLLQRFTKGHQLTSFQGENRDVFAMVREGGLVALSVILVRSGKIVDNRNFGFTDVSSFDEELMETAIYQFYESASEVPEEIVVPFELPGDQALREHIKIVSGKSIEILNPQRGLKARLLRLAELNAKQNFLERFDVDRRNSETAKAIKEALNLPQVPRRVECIDISNLQGSDIVASNVVFMDGLPDKKSYRLYKVSLDGKPDDFASIHEVVLRRLTRAAVSEEVPDLLIIDGGPGQLSAAIKAREESGVPVEIVALAKEREKKVRGAYVEKPERIFMAGHPLPILLKPGEAVTTFMERIRDEAHRFAITYHRARRARRMLRSTLDDIAGVGPERRRRLLKAFGSLAEIGSAEGEAIAKAGRMPLALAMKVKAALQKKNQ